MMKVAGYVRVSTTEQAQEGYGLAAQERSVRSYCEAMSWELVAIYSDAGRSGKSAEGREGLKNLLADAKSGRFEKVIFWKLDRVARNLADLLAICDQLETFKVGLVSLSESIDTGTAAGRMIRSILGAFGQFERETIVERIKAGLAEKARQGKLIGPISLGYRRVDGKVVIDPLTAPLVAELFVRYSSGQYSLRELAEWAATIGLRSTEGNALDRLSVRKILVNVAYIGKIAMHLRKGGGVVADAVHPAIVDVDTFGKVQEMLTSRQRSYTPKYPFGKSPYPLSGIALCSFDHVPLLGARASNKNLRYMRCSTANRQGRLACPQPMVKAEILEDQIGSYVSGMRLPPEYLGAVVSELRSRKKLPQDQNQLAQLEKELERWRRLFVLGEIEESRYKKEVAPIRRKLSELSQPEEVLDVEKAVYFLRDVGSLWNTSTREQQRAFVQDVFARIVVEGPQITAITPKAVYAPLFALDRAERFEGNNARCNMAPRVGGNTELLLV